MSILLDGLPVEAMGLPRSTVGPQAFDISGWLDGPTTDRDTTGLPGLYGVLPSATATGRAREITMAFRWTVDDITDRPAAIALLNEATQGERRFSTVDRPQVVTRVHRTFFRVTPMTLVGSMARTSRTPLEIRLGFVAYDGASYDREPRTLVIGATPKPVVLGTAPSLGILYISGALSSGSGRTLTYTGQNGRTYGTMTLTAPSGIVPESLGAHDTLELDFRQGCRTITKVASGGTRTSAESWLTAGAWFALDPMDASRSVDSFPRLALSSGVGLLKYRRAWRL